MSAPVSIEGTGAPGEHRVAARQHRPDTDDSRPFNTGVAGPECGRRDPHQELDPAAAGSRRPQPEDPARYWRGRQPRPGRRSPGSAGGDRIASDGAGWQRAQLGSCRARGRARRGFRAVRLAVRNRAPPPGNRRAPHSAAGPCRPAPEPTHSPIAAARRCALSGSLPVVRSSASRRAGEAVLGLIRPASSSSCTKTRLLPIISSCACPFSGQRWSGLGSNWLKMAAKIAPSPAASVTASATRLPAIRISVRPLAVRRATIKAISTSVHSTMRSAKPPLRRQTTRVAQAVAAAPPTARSGWPRPGSPCAAAAAARGWRRSAGCADPRSAPAHRADRARRAA